MRTTITLSEPMEALVEKVQAQLSRNRCRKVSVKEAVEWILEDFFWCEPDKPAFGRMSPNMASYVRDTLEGMVLDRHSWKWHKPDLDTATTTE